MKRLEYEYSCSSWNAFLPKFLYSFQILKSIQYLHLMKALEYHLPTESSKPGGFNTWETTDNSWKIAATYIKPFHGENLFLVESQNGLGQILRNV